MPADDTQDERMVSDLDRVILLALETARGGLFDPAGTHLDWLANGPNFTSPVPSRDHEIHVARFSRFLSLVLWAFLHHMDIDRSLWFLMILSYSCQFCLDFTQCGLLFAISLTDYGGNNSTLDLNISKKDSIAPFLQAISHLTLALDIDISDNPNFPTFGDAYKMNFPYAEGYLRSLKIMSRLFHNFSFTGKGT
jgi:hypothetical protein